MKLYKVPNGSKIRLLPEPVEEGETIHPPAHREFEECEELYFYHIDGMYSFCHDKDGNYVHLVAWAEVEVIEES